MPGPCDMLTVDAIVGGLNPEQRDAVTADAGRHTLVLAGAGCGKTTVLTRRVAYLCLSGLEKESILALTFTRKAAGEMAERLGRLLGERRGDGGFPVVTTFHGLGARILREQVGGVPNYQREGYDSAPRLWSGRDRLQCLGNITSKAERAALGGDLRKLDDLLATREVHPSRLEYLTPGGRELLDRVADRVRLSKEKRGCWDFSDMIRATLQLLQVHTDVADHYGGRFRAILVDEFQDTNPVQIAMLQSLLRGENRVFAVGDDDQAIYAFRGADIGPTLTFAEVFHGARIVKLQTNYRSRPAILRSANRVFRNKPPAYRKVLRSGRFAESRKERGVRPHVIRCATQEEMVAKMGEAARRLYRDHEIVASDLALLFRLNTTREWARQRLVPGLSDGALQPHVLTIHAAKGLEFPVVFLCDLEEGLLPHYSLSSLRPRKSLFPAGWMSKTGRKGAELRTECDLEEERRLFYVGLTRAGERLFLVSVKEKELYGRRRKLEPSRFLKLL